MARQCLLQTPPCYSACRMETQTFTVVFHRIFISCCFSPFLLNIDCFCSILGRALIPATPVSYVVQVPTAQLSIRDLDAVKATHPPLNLEPTEGLLACYEPIHVGQQQMISLDNTDRDKFSVGSVGAVHD